MLGFLLVDKPLGWTSHDAVAKVRTQLQTKRVGHSGTLDPLATGLLVLAVGHATRFLNYLDLEPKVYVTEATFGSATTTYDMEGDVTETGDVPTDLEQRLAAAVPQFLGETLQKPPSHSAVKVGGKKLYEYARAGDSIELPDRKVSISRIEILDLAGPTVRISVECGGGTFVRSLVHDLGQAVGCPAHVSALSRTQLGPYALANAVEPALATGDNILPIRAALVDMPHQEANGLESEELRHGRTIPSHTREVGNVLVLDQNLETVCLTWCDGNQLRPKIVIPKGDRDPDPTAG